MKKETLVQLIIITVLTIILIGLVFVTSKEMNSRYNKMFGMTPMEEETVKDTKKEDVDTGKMINAKTIKLDEYDSNITIEDGGEYNIEGSFNHSILVDSTDKVTLNLNNVSINSHITAAIGNKGTGEMVINLVERSTNILKDNGSSELDGCIYSSGKLTIEGKGKLEVYGNQEEGEVIALGSDMLMNPNNTSKQKYVSFIIDPQIKSGSKIGLKDSNENEIISFEAQEDFKTLIISSIKLTNGTYYLYLNGEKTEHSKSIK